MCGIAGLVVPDKRADPARLLAPSLKRLDHRGPDDRGLQVFPSPNGLPHVALGHTRLSVLDLSAQGRQPMSGAGGRLWITYNGEVYNFRELAAELKALGHSFRSRTDTEVVLKAYEQWGPACLEKLNGMYALAVLDLRPSENKLFLARDRLGVKPLYYAHVDGLFGFASEIKALLDWVPKEPDWQALYDYFSFLYVPSPRTAFARIRQLPPGHSLTYDLESRRLELQSYWDPIPDAEPPPAARLREELRWLLEDSVRMQLVSDVPLGLFLSGGIDSTILAGLAARHTDRLRTFTVRFEGEGTRSYDETEAARRVSHMYGTEHHELRVDISRPEELFDRMLAFDQPFANPTLYISYLISKKAREHATVALCGAGGDELFGGYPRYLALPWAGLLGRLPRFAPAALKRALGLFPEDPDRQLLGRLKQLARGMSCGFPEQYLRWTYYFDDAQKRELLGPLLSRQRGIDPSVRLLDSYLREAARLPDLGNRVEYLDLKTFLADNIIEYTDKTSMAASLETRVPFLDHRVVELSLRVPFDQKVRGGRLKRILRETFADLFPPENLKAPKRGFCPPLPIWMDRSLDRYFDERMDRDAVQRQGIFDWDSIQRLRREHKARARDNSMELFGVIAFDLWWKKHAA